MARKAKTKSLSKKDMAASYAQMVAAKIAGRHEYFADAIGVGNIGVIVREAFEEFGIVQRLAARVSVGGKRMYADFYEGYTPAQREFAENLDLWTLENVIVRVLTELDRRRQRHLGGAKKMAEQRGIK